MSYPSAVATPGAAETIRPSPATGAIASSTSAISSSPAPAASALVVLHSRQTADDPVATDTASRSSAVVLASRAEIPAGSTPSPAWSSTKPSSMIVSLRRISWNLRLWPIFVSIGHVLFRGERNCLAPGGMSDRFLHYQEPQLTSPRDRLAARVYPA